MARGMLRDVWKAKKSRAAGEFLFTIFEYRAQPKSRLKQGTNQAKAHSGNTANHLIVSVLQFLNTFTYYLHNTILTLMYVIE